MPVRHAICITVDGLRASALGAYGNTWHPTPALDVLASQSQVFDWMLCDRPTLDGFYASAWRQSGASLAEQLAAAGVQAALTTDDRDIAQRGESIGFAEIRRIEFTSDQSAATVAETELAQLFAVAVDQLESWADAAKFADAPPAPRLLWVHARGFHGAWDAPLELRESLLDDEDPPAPAYVTPPTMVSAADHDAILLYRAAYAAQTMVLDACVDALLAALAEYRLDENTLVILTSARGYALGEHGVAGGDATALYGELLHVPCLVREPGAIAPPPRSSQLSQPADLHATLLDWFGVAATEPSKSEVSLLASDLSLASEARQEDRQFVIAIAGDGGRAIRTPAWMLYQRPPQAAPPPDQPAASTVELYLKPDDRWEANEIADRCPDVAAQLLAVLDLAVLPVDAQAPAIVPLDEHLVAHAR